MYLGSRGIVLCSKNKGADQLRGDCFFFFADAKLWFSHDMAHIVLCFLWLLLPDHKGSLMKILYAETLLFDQHSFSKVVYIFLKELYSILIWRSFHTTVPIKWLCTQEKLGSAGVSKRLVLAVGSASG